jgi:hypothetical protein
MRKFSCFAVALTSALLLAVFTPAASHGAVASAHTSTWGTGHTSTWGTGHTSTWGTGHASTWGTGHALTRPALVARRRGAHLLT